MSDSTEITILPPALSPAVVFAPGGVEDVLKQIRDKVANVTKDISTPAGRQEIKTAAYNIARSKTALDEMGKNLVAELKAEARAAAAEAQAKAAAEAAEQARIEAERQSKERERLAAEKAEKDKLAAIEAERQRVAEEQARDKAESERREKDKKHKAAVNMAAVQALVKDAAISEDTAKAVITAIAKGLVPNVKISY